MLRTTAPPQSRDVSSLEVMAADVESLKMRSASAFGKGVGDQATLKQCKHFKQCHLSRAYEDCVIPWTRSEEYDRRHYHM